jgi:hypothetical protein
VQTTPVQIAKPAQPPAESSKAVLPIESLDEPVGVPAVDSPAVDTEAVEPGQRPIRGVAVLEPQIRVSIARVVPADTGPALVSPEPASAEDDAASAAATARPANRAPPPQSDVSLIIAERDGGIELVAAGPALDPQACALLRRLARAILARNGLALAQFHLNGVPLAPDSTIMIGGSHGTRTR